MTSVAALAVLAMLSVAQAERALLAHRPSGGSSLHALAITSGNYFSTNGNGTWASNVNRAYGAASACGGASYGATTTTIAANAPAPFFKNGYSITAITFPSRLLGVAVGTGCTTNAGYTDPDFPTWITPATTNPAFFPTVLATFDQGATWQAANGFSTTPKSFAQTAQYSINPTTIVATTPTLIAPDLYSVHCTTRSLCLAAGGYFGSSTLAVIPAINWLAQVTKAVTGGFVIANVMPVAGAVIRSTNGGTFWTYVTLPNIVAATTTSGPVPVPGLTDISTDSSGRNVFAVGTPFFAAATFSYPAAAGLEPYSAAIPLATYSIASGTILYSGAYGVTNSWVVQTAPKIPGMWYSLNAVTVLRGTTAITVGGSPFGLSANGYTQIVASGLSGYTAVTAAPLKGSGVILMTFNGGFSWIQQNLPSWSYWTGPSTVIGGLTPIINDGAGGGATAAQIAAGAAATSVITNVYATAASSSSLLPALRDVACYSSSSPSGGSASYNCMAVGDFGYVVRASYPAVTMSNTVMTSTMSWSAVNVTQVSVPSGFLDLYGITWDNNRVGYMYGEQTILSTHDGGVTWVSETPNGIVAAATATSGTTLVGLATVPTTF